MSIRKRALSLLLVLVMLLGVLPAGAAAAEVYQDVPSGIGPAIILRASRSRASWSAPLTRRSLRKRRSPGAMFVTILARYAKAETDNNAETAFTDVPAGQYYTGARCLGCG